MQSILKKVIYTGIFLVPFIPFLVSSSFFFPFIVSKAFAFRIIVEIIFASWILLALSNEEYRLKKSSILYAVISFLAVMGLANIFGVDPSRSFWSNFERMEGYVTLLHLGAFFVVIGSVFKEIDWKRWWNTSLVASAVMILYCLMQLSGAITINQGGVRVDGTFGNASYLAVYMLIHIFITIWFLSRDWKRRGLRWTYALLLVGQLTILYHTATRGAILGLLGGLFIAALLNVRNREEAKVRKMSLGIIAALALVVGGFFVFKDSALVENSPVLSRFASISTEELQGGGRSYVWPMALEGFKERPILGWGQENFQYVFQEHYSPEMYRLEPWFDRAHNIFLDWMVAGGFLGVISYLSLYLVFLYVVWRKDTGLTHFEKTTLTGALAAYFFHNFFVFDHLVSYILFFALLAYVYSRTDGEVLWSKNVSDRKLGKIITPGVVVLALIVLYFVNIVPMRTNAAIIDAMISSRSSKYEEAVNSLESAYQGSRLGKEEVVQQIISNSQSIITGETSNELKTDFLTLANGAAMKSAEEYGDDAKLLIATGSFLGEIGREEEAIAHLQRAQELIPNKQQVYFELGATYINMDEPAKALEAFRAAYELAPEYVEAKIIYLVGAIYAEDVNLETKLLSEIEERTLVFDRRVLSAYYNVGRINSAITILEKRKELDPQNVSEYERLINQFRNR